MPSSPQVPVALAAALVSVGGAAGATARWALQSAFPAAPAAFPWTTFGINVVGSFLLALLPATPALRRRPWATPLMGTGLLGGFTTLSATSEEGRYLLAEGHTALAAAYLLGTLVAALAAVAVATRLTSSAVRGHGDHR